MLSKEAAGQKVRQKKHFHQALLRKGFFVPSYSAPICTQDFLEEVRHKITWVPMQHEIQARIVVDPPNNKLLKEMVVAAIQKKCSEAGPNADPSQVESLLRLANLLERRQADAKFYIGVIACLDVTHDIFGVDYMPPIQEKLSQPSASVDNADNFFADLPFLPTSQLKKRMTICKKEKGLSRQKMQEQEIQLLKQQIAELQQGVQQHNAQ